MTKLAQTATTLSASAVSLFSLPSFKAEEDMRACAATTTGSFCQVQAAADKMRAFGTCRM